MSRFLICTLPMPGHVNPGLPIARALTNRGHEVVWYTGQRSVRSVQLLRSQRCRRSNCRRLMSS